MKRHEPRRVRVLRRRVVGDAVAVTLFATRMMLLGLGLLLQRGDRAASRPR